MKIPRRLPFNVQSDRHAAEQIDYARYVLANRESFERKWPETVERAIDTLRYHGLEPTAPTPKTKQEEQAKLF